MHSRPALAILLLLLLAPQPAFAQTRTTGPVGANFDHLTPGFELTGAHLGARCESCHVGGVFKGTPTQCVGCHTAGARIGASAKPANHVLTTDRCADWCARTETGSANNLRCP